MDQDKNTKIKDLLDVSKNIAVLPSKVAGVDAFAAASGLFLMLKAKEKPVKFLHPGKVPDECTELLKSEEILTDVGQRELLVSIDYSNTAASKVHYYTENDVLFLSVSPITKDFDLNRIKSDIKGFNYDLIITVGAQSLEDYGQSFKELEDEFKKSALINIDNTDRNSGYGKINVIDSKEDSLSLMILNKSMAWDLKVDPRSAKALLTGITYRKATL